MLGRLLDDTYSPEVRDRITLLTVIRTVTNTAYRFAPPFLATIATGFDVPLSRVALALSISEIGGLTSPLLGRMLDRLPRRAAMVTGLAGMAASAAGAAVAPGVGVFTVALVVLAFAKLIFDVAMTGWLAERVPFAQRGRAIGIVELSWAGGLLIGVPLLGLVTWWTSWPVAYGLIAAGLTASAGIVLRSLPDPAQLVGAAAPGSVAASADGGGDDVTDVNGDADRSTGADEPSLLRRMAPLMIGNFCLMFAAQCGFVTFGSWLEDDHGFTSAALAAVAFVLGGGELAASSSAVRFTDRWGKVPSMRIGALMMVPAAVLLALGHGTVAVGIAALVVLIAGFEFAIVSSLPLSTMLLPGRPSTGLGIVLVAGTAGRAAASVPAARLYEDHGMRAPMLLAAVVAIGSVAVTAIVHEPSS